MQESISLWEWKRQSTNGHSWAQTLQPLGTLNSQSKRSRPDFRCPIIPANALLKITSIKICWNECEALGSPWVLSDCVCVSLSWRFVCGSVQVLHVRMPHSAAGYTKIIYAYVSLSLALYWDLACLTHLMLTLELFIVHKGSIIQKIISTHCYRTIWQSKELNSWIEPKHDLLSWSIISYW